MSTITQQEATTVVSEPIAAPISYKAAARDTTKATLRARLAGLVTWYKHAVTSPVTRQEEKEWRETGF